MKKLLNYILFILECSQETRMKPDLLLKSPGISFFASPIPIQYISQPKELSTFAAFGSVIIGTAVFEN